MIKVAVQMLLGPEATTRFHSDESMDPNTMLFWPGFFLFCFFVFAFLKNKATEHKSSIISLAQCMHKATETFAKHYRCEN